MQDLIGRRIGSYEVTERLGQGGMATVYKAVQVSLNRNVALKVPAAVPGAGPHLRGAVPAGGERCRQPATPEHSADLRLWARRRLLLHCDGPGAGRPFARPGRAVADGALAAHCRADCRRPGPRPQPEHRPPRHQTDKYPDGPRRLGSAWRLRDCPPPRNRRASPPPRPASARRST